MPDFSIAAGHPREAHGLESNRYSPGLAYSSSLRDGLGSRLPLQAHAEGKPGLSMFGLGFTATRLQRAETSLVGGSRYEGETSRCIVGTRRTRLRRGDVDVSGPRSEKGFADLANATGVDYLGAAAVAGSKSLLEFPREQEVIGVTMPAAGHRHTLGLSLVPARRDRRV